MGSGIDAKKAPNFPVINKIIDNLNIQVKQQVNVVGNLNKHEPKMEKKNMKPAETWITLRLPTLVSPRRPTFSLQYLRIKLYKLKKYYKTI